MKLNTWKSIHNETNGLRSSHTEKSWVEVAFRLRELESIEAIVELGLFVKYCDVCGMKVNKGQDFVRFGKHFCSQEHANKYATEMEQRRLSTPTEKASGCC